MKIAILDMVFNNGHQNINRKIISYLSDNNEVIVIHNHFYDDLKCCQLIQCNDLHQPEGKVKGRIQNYNNIIQEFEKIKKVGVDYIFILSCEWISLSFCIRRLLNVSRVGVLHHNLNQFDNKIKFYFYHKYANLIDNFVLDDSLVEPLCKVYRVKEEQIKSFPHPITLEICQRRQGIELSYLSQLSGSINQKKINELYENKNRIKLNEGTKLLIKNKEINFVSEDIVFTKEYFTSDRFDEYLSLSKAFLFCFPQDFCYRISSVLLGAIGNGRIAICNDFYWARKLKKKYPNLVYIYKDINELVDLINNIDGMLNENLISLDLKEIRKDRSDERLRGLLNRLIESK